MNDYREARKRLDAFLERDHARVADDCRSFCLDHGRRTEHATLLLHGLSASPRQFEAVAQALHERGHNVFVPRLPKHGYSNRMTEALATLDAAELKTCAKQALEIVSDMGERVSVSGFSMGGTLAAYLGQHYPVERVVAVVPFLGIALLPGALHERMAHWVLRRRNRFLWWDPLLRERQMPAHGYPRYATHAIAHGLQLAHELFEDARHAAPLAQRLTLVLNARESSVSNTAVLKLARAWLAKRPQGIDVYRFKDLPYMHDIIEPLRAPAVAKRVLPVLVDLIES